MNKLHRVVCRDVVGNMRAIRAQDARELYREGDWIVYVDSSGHRWETPNSNVVSVEPFSQEQERACDRATQPEPRAPAAEQAPATPPPAPAVPPPAPPAPLISPNVKTKSRGGKWAAKDAHLGIVPAHAVVADPVNLPTPGAAALC